ncbi:MAG: High-affinity zinc uptake system ATP-binding protein ZnuC [Verrucomicrobiae bacterium]|nr:High-affinity zinc uptake system ATP-binding protein ZnuC [Verrucomicrobiae bacterium]
MTDETTQPAETRQTIGHPRWPYARRVCHAFRPDAPALAVRDVTVSYPGAPRPALVALTLTVAAGASVALVGCNGAGKSTLLKAIVGLLPLTGGDIRVGGLPRGGCHHHVAYLPQRNALDWRFPITVRRLVVTGRYAHLGWLRRPGAADWTAADAALAELDMTGLAQRQISELSGGQQQRALLARSLAQGAELLLLDEPLNEVDAATRSAFGAALARWRAADQRRAVLTATHHLHCSEISFDSVIGLAEGRLAEPAGDWEVVR